MGFKIKNSLTGEFEKLPILTLKGEKGETGGVEEYNKVDYMGNKYETLKQANDANVEYAVKTAIGEFNYLDYDGQHITATDTIEGRSKSAILKGQTLVNIHELITPSLAAADNDWYENLTVAHGEISFDVISAPTAWRYISAGKLNYQMLKPNTKYLVVFESSQNLSSIHFMCGDGLHGFAPSTVPVENNKAIITTNSQIVVDKQILYVNFYAEPNTKVSFKNPMIIEYQEGMENWDIPYFEGMTSVKAPVLKSVGKNLCKYGNNWTHGGLTFTHTENGVSVNGTATVYVDYYVIDDRNINLEIRNQLNSLPVGTRLVLSNNLGKNSYISYILNGEVRYADNVTIQNNMEIKGAFVRFQEGDVCKNLNLTIQLEIGTKATPYEPYKSNILTTPEDLELRGIGDVKDELNVATGEVVQKFTTKTYNGSENWALHASSSNLVNCLHFFINENDMERNGKVISPQIKTLNYSELEDDEHISIGGSRHLHYIVNKNKLTSQNLNGFKQWLSQNPITVQYQLETPITKTVDLSDNNVYSYKDVTHYNCSSAEGSLVPTLSVKVPTDVQATIAQQRETIQTLNSENERLNQIQEALKASMLDSQVQLMNLSWNTDFEVFTLRESIAPKDFLLASRTGSNIDKFSQAKFIIENDCPDLEKLNSQIEYYFSKDIFSQEQFEELTDLISIVKGENGCEY